MARSRGWFFTLNNYAEDDAEKLIDLVFQEELQYIAFEAETGESGTPHLQGFLYTPHAKTRSAVSKLMPRAWLAPKAGTDEQCKKYCNKEAGIMWMGTPPEQGKRTDIETFVQELKAEPDFRTLAMKHPRHCLRMMRNAKELHAIFHEPSYEYKKPTVLVVYGKAGIGKTRRAHEYFRSKRVRYYVKGAASEKWWDGFYNHKGIIMDDFRSNQMKFHELLLLLDGYGTQQQTKGGFTHVQADTIIITSDQHPKDWYQNCTNDDNAWAQLERRITEIINMDT